MALSALLVAIFAAFVAVHPPYLEDPKLADDGPWLYVDKPSRPDAFRQLEEILPTPNDQRTASGAPGPKYWQQRASHRIRATLDAERHRLEGWTRIRYENNSPDELRYLWVQLEQNRFRRDSVGELTDPAPDLSQPLGISWLRGIALSRRWEGGYDIRSVRDAEGRALPHAIVDTMMRIDLPAPLGPGEAMEFEIDFAFPILFANLTRARSCYELLPKTNAPLYEMAQWFPRMAAYTDVNGWQHKRFLGAGEFTLEFGDYEVELDVPDTFVVAATGTLANPEEVLTPAQRERLATAAQAERPVFIVTPEEAKENESRAATGRRVWRFVAQDVRDFAWAASAAFAWDAMGVAIPGTDRRALAMSFYPELAAGLWSLYSTQAVAHTLEVYSRIAFPYPYPVAISVNGPVGGMEYPMITFNGPRPEPDGTWTARTKYGLIGVVIHEIGHIWFPMVINSDERQWTWMDEGLNTFCQYLAEQEWAERYPSGRGEPSAIIAHMTSRRQTPIMTDSDSVLQFGPSQYAKPATALNVLRESVLGRELFDFAFREYCRRWAFRRPQPADFFRTMEDASGVDLDWFWRTWFYSNDHCDVAIERVVTYRPRGLDVERDRAFDRARRDAERDPTLSVERNRPLPKRVERFPELIDFYDSFDELDVTPQDRRSYERFLADLEEDELAALRETDRLHFTVVRFRNLGGLITFLPLELTYADGSTEFVRLPAEIWRRDSVLTSKLFITDRPIVRVELDPRRETADADRTNNLYPPAIREETFTVTKPPKERNPMQLARDEERRAACERMALELAPILLAAWSDLPRDRHPTPLSAAGELMRIATDGGRLVAPTGSSVRIEFADRVAAAGESLARTPFATVVIESVAPHEKGATPPEPARMTIWFDGSVAPDWRRR
jgi:hypothetical protein